MTALLPHLVVAAILGAALISGLLFAFSNVVMRSLLDLPAEHGMRAMQRINVVILNPLFLTLFMGTTLLCGVIGWSGARALPAPAGAWLLAGALAYLVGPFAITVAFNVPLNDRLAATAPGDAATQWPRYAAAWLRWNHLRTLLGAASVVLLSLGLAS